MLILAFCTPERNKNNSDTYYDITGLVDEQIKLLNAASPSVLKRALISGQEESNTIEPNDSAAWAKELGILKAIDINKSRLKDSYNVSETPYPEKTVITYESKYPENTDVELLTIVLDKNHQPLNIQAKLDIRNQLFASAKIIAMDFRDLNGQRILAGFQTSGWQKMVSIDSASYAIEAKIIFKN